MPPFARSLFFALLALTPTPPCLLGHDLALPRAGDRALRVLSPTVLELSVVTQHHAPDQPLADLVRENPPSPLLAPDSFVVAADGTRVAVKSVGFKRRVLYAPLHDADVRLGNWLYLELAQPLPSHATVTLAPAHPRPPSAADTLSASLATVVANPTSRNETAPDHSPPRADQRLWPADWQLSARLDPARESPALHVSFVGYDRLLPKFARVGYYLGSLGELPITATSFALVEAGSGHVVHRGKLTRQPERGTGLAPPPYQEVFVADFSRFQTPGLYRLEVEGLGVSPPFRIHDAAALAFARTYTLGLYHQRCGTPNALPFTRHTHAACHTAPAAVPATAAAFPFTWKLIGELAAEQRPDASQPPHPFTASEQSQLYPFVRRDPIDASGGHHDAGDYSKYTTNSAALIHTLVFAVDALPGLSAFDHLGLPESDDGIPDLLQIAKGEADFLLKLQDDDGGFAFLVYPRDRRYESEVLPDAGDAQVIWPKNSAATAAAVAALAQTAASRHFQRHFASDAARYLAAAHRGWKFLQTALSRHGTAGAYQRLTHYGDNFAHDDELAWAACELFLATGEPEYQRELFRLLPDPADAALRRWGWWRLSESWGNALRSYAFSLRTERQPVARLDAAYLRACRAELLSAGDDAVARSTASAYGTAFPLETKRTRNGGWYFSLDSAFDLAVAHVLEPRDAFLSALVTNLGYEAGVNPVNRGFVTGIGPKRQREVVHQFAQNDRRALPPSGLPIGNIASGLPYHAPSAIPLRQLSFPADDDARSPFPFSDRWSDVHNVSTEFVVTNQARGLATACYLATLARAPRGRWRAVEARIVLSAENPRLGEHVTAQLELSTPPDSARRRQDNGAALHSAEIIWEARDHEPRRGLEFTFTPQRSGTQWIEAEVLWPDGRRAFAAREFLLPAPETAWVDDAFPVGAQPHAGAVRWITHAPSPKSGTRAHSAATSGPGLHEHGFDRANEALEIGADDLLFAEVWLDPEAPPRALMLAWSDGSWEHRAYWGENVIPYGVDGSAGRQRLGDLPRAGEWVRLEVPARAVALAGKKVRGVSFSVFEGRAVWDRSGVSTGPKPR